MMMMMMMTFGVDGDGVLEDEDGSPVVTRDENRLEWLAQASEQFAQPQPSVMAFAAARSSISVFEAVEKVSAGGRRLGQQVGRQVM